MGALVDSLSSERNCPRPCAFWPPKIFDRPLATGARAGTGRFATSSNPIRRGYPIRFRFIAPSGFAGFHAFEVLAATDGKITLRHTVRMQTSGRALLSWPFAYRPLHDALIEDALAQATASLGLESQVRPWSRWVEVLRSLFSRGKAVKQRKPSQVPNPTAL